jgi:hypothetical protein
MILTILESMKSSLDAKFTTVLHAILEDFESELCDTYVIFYLFKCVLYSSECISNN